MTEHPMITAMDTAIENSERVPDFTRNSAVAALQWMADPSNLSDDVVEAVAIALYVDAGVDNNDPETWPDYPEPCKDEYRIAAWNAITALANALRKEIEGHG